MPTYFPSADITGVPNSRWYAAPLDYKAITQEYEYEDGGKDFNEVAPPASAPRRWQVVINCVAATHTAAKVIADVYEDFFDSVRYSQPFLFTDKYGDVWDNVYVESYERNHDAHRSWVINVIFNLVGYGSVAADTTSPFAPTAVTATPISSTSVLISWDAAIDPDPSTDDVPPTVPTGLSLESRTTSSITIGWEASTD